MNYKYKAFISYRHRETDKFVASKIQKLLESFRMKGVEPWKLFRDESELPTSNSLSDDIEHALTNSEYLIVICTPALKESRWCMQEINTFKALHNGSTDKILPILVEGDPDEVFPDQLRTSRKLVPDPATGTKIYKDIEIEPLAANVCGADFKEINRKLKVEYLRLAAPMAGVGFDDLYNRKRRQQVKRISLAASGVVAAALAFGVYNFSMNLKLEDKNQQISEQLVKTKIANSEALNGQADALYDGGRIRDALETYLSTYEMNEEHTALVPSSDKLLSSAIDAYSVETPLPSVRLPHLIDVKEFYFRDDGHRIVSIDTNRNIYLWNADDGTLVRQWKQNARGQGSVTCLITDSHRVKNEMLIEYLYRDSIYGYASNIGGMVSYGFRPINENMEIPAEDTDTFILFNHEKMWIVDAASGEDTLVKIEDVAGENYHFTDWAGTPVAISETAEKDNVLVLSKEDASVIRKVTIDLTKPQPFYAVSDQYMLSRSLVGSNLTGYPDWNITGEASETIRFENEDMSSPMSQKLFQTGPYIVDIEQGTTGSDTIDFDTIRFVVYDTAGNKKWTFSDALYSGKMLDALFIPAEENEFGQDVLLLVYGNYSKVCDASSGKVLDEKSYEEEVLDYRVGNTGMVEVTLQNGQVLRHRIGDPFKKIVLDTRSKPKQMKSCANKTAVMTDSGSKNIDIFIREENEDAILLGRSQDITGNEKSGVSSVKISRDGEEIYYYDHHTNEIFSYSVKSKEKHLLYTSDSYVNAIYELKNAICIGSWNTITFVDKTDGHILLDPLEVDQYSFIPETQELMYALPSLMDSSYTPIHELVFTDGSNKTTYGLGENSTDYLKACYFSEDGSRFALVYEEEKTVNDEYRSWNSLLLCDRNTDTGPWKAELNETEPCICNVRFSTDNQTCMVSLNMQDMSVHEELTPGKLELLDFESGKSMFTHDTERGLIIDSYMPGEDMYLLCADYTLEVISMNQTQKASINLDEEDLYSDMKANSTEFRFVPLENHELLIFNQSKGFIIDTEKNALRMIAEDAANFGKICGFIRDEQRIVIATPWQVSSYPIFTSNELYQKTRKLLSLT